MYAEVDTNDDDYEIIGVVTHVGVMEMDKPSMTLTASEIYRCCIEHGGKLRAMQ